MLFGSMSLIELSLLRISMIISNLKQSLKMEHFISIYYKEDHFRSIYYTIFVPSEQKEKREEEICSEKLDIPPAFS